MEKLQKALHKAKQERDGATPPTDRPRRSRSDQRTPGPAGTFPPVWDALAPFDPDPHLLMRNRIMTLQARPDANPFDILRTKIFLIMRENGWTRMAITSPDQGSGKTTTACNLAVGFSRQREIRSMLLDMDFRRPGVASLLGHTPAHEVRDVIVGDVPAEQQMVRLRENVALSMSRYPVNDPMQALLSRSMTDVVGRIQEQFALDVMMFDLPPMLVSDDARAVLKNVDCALIVARAEQTKTAQLDVCEREVSEYTNVLGVVLNNCRHVSDEADYGGAYD